MYHFYRATTVQRPDDWSYDEICSICKYNSYHPSHPRNPSVLCDVEGFPCACGSWHPMGYLNEMNYELMKKVGMPDYEPTKVEQEILKLEFTNGV
jgi:hypothetical protein